MSAPNPGSEVEGRQSVATNNPHTVTDSKISVNIASPTLRLPVDSASPKHGVISGYKVFDSKIYRTLDGSNQCTAFLYACLFSWYNGIIGLDQKSKCGVCLPAGGCGLETYK